MWDSKRKALFLGMGVATVIALSVGGALSPAVGAMSENVRLPSPTDLGVSPVALAEAADWASAGPGIPDYVIAQDAAADAPLAPAPPPPPPPKHEPAPPTAHTAERQPPKLDYPSLGAGLRAGMDSYAPPTPPSDEPPRPPR